MHINDACDYIIVKLKTGGLSLSVLKLQKLLYYVQAWSLALRHRRLFEGRFQAWVHGPVSREIYDRFLATKSLYSDVNADDVRPDFDLDALDPEERTHIDTVLDVYAKFHGSQLEDLTHNEEPWIEARKGYRPSERCENEINESTMERFYAQIAG
jgi:uncharacterized phage-associated protein